MNSLHDLIWQHYRTTVKLGTQISEDHSLINDQDEFLRKVFHNHTAACTNLRLTPLGFTVVSKLYQYWSMDLPKNWPDLVNRTHVLLKLRNKLRFPYYWDRRYLYVFNSEVALEFEMAGRDFEVWTKMF